MNIFLRFWRGKRRSTNTREHEADKLKRKRNQTRDLESKTRERKSVDTSRKDQASWRKIYSSVLCRDWRRNWSL